ncbi:MAG: hypothetical protein EXS32_12255 [Opitutus sp.]|nr:hypothetical protein [Opitutus sp.]
MKPVLRLVIAVALACGAHSARAAWTPPDAAQLARLERALAPQHAQWDPAEQMPKRPFSSPGYHTTLKGGFVHSTRDAFTYAVGLLDPGKPEHLDRACAILRRVIALQDSDPAAKHAALTLTSPTQATLTAGELTFHVTLAQARLGDLPGKLTTGRSRDLRFLDVEFYHGAEREFDLATLSEALTAFALSVGPHGPVTAKTDAGKLTLICDTLTVTAAMHPTP